MKTIQVVTEVQLDPKEFRKYVIAGIGVAAGIFLVSYGFGFTAGKIFMKTAMK